MDFVYSSVFHIFAVYFMSVFACGKQQPVAVYHVILQEGMMYRNVGVACVPSTGLFGTKRGGATFRSLSSALQQAWKSVAA